MNKARISVLGLIFALFMAVGMPVASAASLPYTWTFSGLSGGSSGVSTGSFSKSGVLCVEKDYIRVANPYNKTYSSKTNFTMVKDVSFGFDVNVGTVSFYKGETNETKCFPTVPSGLYYVVIQKAEYNTFVTLTGRGYLR